MIAGHGQLIAHHEQLFARNAELFARYTELIASRAEFVAYQEAAEKLHVRKMSEFDEKLNARIDIVGKMQGGMESRPS